MRLAAGPDDRPGQAQVRVLRAISVEEVLVQRVRVEHAIPQPHMAHDTRDGSGQPCGLLDARFVGVAASVALGRIFEQADRVQPVRADDRIEPTARPEHLAPASARASPNCWPSWRPPRPPG